MQNQPDILFIEMLKERQRQIAKFGTQADTPSTVPEDMRLFWLHIGTEARCKAQCDKDFGKGQGTWAHIAIEELAEAIDAPDEEHRRAELVQLATVCMGWIEAIDAKAGKTCAECGGTGWFSPTPVKADGWPCKNCTSE